MAYSFRGHTFLASRPDDIWVSMPPPPERIEERSHVLYSAKNIIFDAGDGVSTWSLIIYCTPAERTAILSDRAKVGVLVTPDATYSNSKLSQIRDAGVLLDRTMYSLAVEFIVA